MKILHSVPTGVRILLSPLPSQAVLERAESQRPTRDGIRRGISSNGRDVGITTECSSVQVPSILRRIDAEPTTTGNPVSLPLDSDPASAKVLFPDKGVRFLCGEKNGGDGMI
jgi:hypothetical protein